MSPRKVDLAASKNKRKSILRGISMVIAEKGYIGVTMKSVAAAAGVSHGLLHYYFTNKEDMMLALLRENTEQLLEIFSETFSGLKPGDDVAHVITVAYRRMHEDFPQYFNVFAELWPLLWTSRQMEQGFKELFFEFREAIVVMFEHFVREGVLFPKLPIREMVYMINAQCDGLELQLRVDPALLHDDTFWEAYEFTLRALFDCPGQ